MFYACLTIFIFLIIIIFCVTLAITDLETYNFGLYIVLLCIIGTMLACALCIANPNACPNPTWYTNFCIMLQEMYMSSKNAKNFEVNDVRLKKSCLMGQDINANTDDLNNLYRNKKLLHRQEFRATAAMLTPAVHIMHQVWKGMAWVTDGIEEDITEDKTKSDKAIELNESSSLCTSSHDVII